MVETTPLQKNTNRKCVICGLLIAVALFFAMPSTAYTESAEGLLKSIEFKALSLKSLPKWTRVLGKIKREEEIFRICETDPTRCKEDAYLEWVKFIQDNNKNKSIPIREKLEKVNSFANKWPYKTDMEVWQRSDYWASPAEFLKYSGDCEDYAITKFVSLKKMGIPPENLRIAVVQDTIRNIAHAVLSVKINNTYYVLDSLINMVVKDTRLPHYIPQYSVNDTTRWAHIMPKQAVESIAEDKQKSPLSLDEDDTYLLLFDTYGEN